MRPVQQVPIQGIVILRALQLGDLLCSVPALRALRAAFPAAHIALVGLPGAADFVRRFSDYIDELLPFPGISEFPEQVAREDALPAFYRTVRRRRFDLALQLHGSGTLSVSIVRRFGARCWAGFVPQASQAVPGWRMPWPDRLPEPLRYLALLQHLGIACRGDALELPLLPGEQAAALGLMRRRGLPADRTVLIHPGARLPSRRWPAERFAAVARALCASGWTVAVTGTSSEAPIVERMLERCPPTVVNLCGATSVGVLAALLQQVRLLISNDTGVSHIAAAVQAPSLIIACGSDTARWAPLNEHRHHVLSVSLPCRPCLYDECPIGHPCALGVPVRDVVDRARERLRRSHPLQGDRVDQVSVRPPLRAGSGGEYASPASSAGTRLSGLTSSGS